MVPERQKVWKDGQNGLTDAWSKDNKQAKSNGNIDLKKKQFSFNSSSKIKAIETDLMPVTQNEIKEKVCLLPAHNEKIFHFVPNAHD